MTDEPIDLDEIRTQYNVRRDTVAALCDDIERLRIELAAERQARIDLMRLRDFLEAHIDAALALHVMEPITETKWDGNWFSCRECRIAKLDDGVCPTVRALTKEAS